MADRYTYLPSLGPFLLCGLAVSMLWSTANAPGKQFLFRIAIVPVFLVLLVSLTYRTVEQIGIWKNGFTLWTPIIEKEPGKAIPTAYNNRANFFLRMGEFDKAIADYDKVLSVYPSDPVAYIWRKIAIISYVNRGKSYLESGNYDLAVSDFQKACDYGNEEGCRALQAMGLR